MSDLRLSLAAQDGLFALPDKAKVLVMRPKPDHSLALFPKETTTIEHGFYPEHARLQSRGWNVTPRAQGQFDLAVVFAQRNRAHSQSLIARAAAMADGGPVILDGQKTDGIEPLIKALKKVGADVGTAISKAHGKLVVFQGGDFAGWLQEPTRKAHGYVTDAAVFSADKVDAGSALLAAALPGDLGGKVADLGAGWGYLSAQVLTRAAVTECHLVEAEYDALACAKSNIAGDRATFHWADARDQNGLAGLDHVVMNPPFHTGRAAQPELGQAMIAAAARILAPKGQLWMVANRHLPYEHSLTQHFGEISELAGNPAFKVLRAARPKPANRRT